MFVTVGMCQEAVEAYLKVTEFQCHLNLITNVLNILRQHVINQNVKCFCIVSYVIFTLHL